MRLLVATDAWRPQINGVVRSLEHMAKEAAHFGAEIVFVTPQDFRSFPMPGYGEIRLAIASPGALSDILTTVKPTHVHIATEGPIGLLMRRACIRHGRAFTTSYHTRFPEYLSARAPVPEDWTYRALRRFHGAARATLVSTNSLETQLRERGFQNLVRWTRGVDTDLFCPRSDASLNFPGPLFLYVGRVAVEKNIEAFLSLDLPGTKVIVGDGPAKASLSERYPAARFLGALTGENLAKIYAACDVFVFPSLTDTFGIVLIEALASGLPVAAFPVTGPLDVIAGSHCGVLNHDLQSACLRALDISRARCRAYGESFTWRESARQFFTTIQGAQAA